MAYKKKLIEVSIPLEEINKAAVKEKTIRHGHPSSLHLWWARRPLATARAVLFSSMVDDPSEHPELFDTEEKVSTERKRLHDLIVQLVQWENVGNEEILNQAREEIRKSCGDNIPTVWDPFCGGGTIPLEAQRLGLPAIGSDLNPVAVMINKAMIEIPPLFKDMPPVNPDDRSYGTEGYKGTAGLAADIRYYGEWIRNEAEVRIGYLYPKVMRNGRELPVIAWIYARTVKCPNPACSIETPLVRSFILSKVKKKRAYVEPLIKDKNTSYKVHSEKDIRKPNDKFEIPKWAEDGTIGRQGAICIHCGAGISFDYIRSESCEGKMNRHLLSIVANGGTGYGRIYCDPNTQHQISADISKPRDYPNGDLANWPGHINVYKYGMTEFHQLFTNRQLTAMVTFSDLIMEAVKKVHSAAVKVGISEGESLNCGGKGASAYSQAVGVYLGFAVDKVADYHNSLSSWQSPRETMRNLFARQAIPMVWDYVVSNPIGFSSGSYNSMIDQICRVMTNLPASSSGKALQHDATKPIEGYLHVFSTDPPYYDNIGYADLSDFFYVWMRRSLKEIYPDLFRTMMVPKAEELVAIPYRFNGNKSMAQTFFEDGLFKTFQNVRSGSEKTISDNYLLCL